MQEAKAAEREAEAARLAAEAEERRKKEEEEAIERIVAKEEPLIARPYKSTTAEDTEFEVAESGPIRPSRPLVSIRMQRRRYNFGARVSLHDRETEHLLADFRTKKEK